MNQAELWQLRAWIQRIGWGPFMRHIGSIMAEQADKVKRGSEQDGSLFSCSNTIHALDEFFQKCGHFDYLKMRDMLPEEHIAVLEANPPPKA